MSSFLVVGAQAIVRDQAKKPSVTHKGAGVPQKRASLLRRIFPCRRQARLLRAEIELHHYRQLYNDAGDSPRMDKR